MLGFWRYRRISFRDFRRTRLARSFGSRGRGAGGDRARIRAMLGPGDPARAQPLATTGQGRARGGRCRRSEWTRRSTTRSRRIPFPARRNAHNGHRLGGVELQTSTMLKVPQGYSMEKHGNWLLNKIGGDHFRLMPASCLRWAWGMCAVAGCRGQPGGSTGGGDGGGDRESQRT